MEPLIRVQSEDFDVAAEAARITQGRVDIGAIVSFTGLCRSEDGALSALELEHYPGMAEDELGRVAGEAKARWALDGLTIIHRYGKLFPGENIVLVIAAARHRKDAFEAADFLMDYLKTRAPFWKKEHPASGERGGWVAAKAEDDAAASRWDAAKS